MSHRYLLALLALCAASCAQPTLSTTDPGNAAADAMLTKAAAPAKPAPLPTALPAAPTGYDAVREGIAHGKLEHIEYASKTSGITRKAVVYLPPGYAASTKYPVLYLLHGAGGDETRWTATGNAENILDNLYAEHKPVPMIAVMPNIFAPLAGATQPAAGRGGSQTPGLEGDLITDLIPYIDGHYAVLPGRQNRALIGLSLGGEQGLTIGMKHLDQFAWLGGLSPAVNAGGGRGARGGGTSLVDTLFPDPAAANAQLKLLWLSCGEQDSLFPAVQSLHTAMEGKSVAHVWHSQQGVHEWPVWKTDLYYFAPLLFQN